jgi:hypothetical protein
LIKKRSIIKDLNNALFKLILDEFHEKIKRVKEFYQLKDSDKSNEQTNESLITQNNALQMIFDLKFLNILFDSSTKDDATAVNFKFFRFNSNGYLAFLKTRLCRQNLELSVMNSKNLLIRLISIY